MSNTNEDAKPKRESVKELPQKRRKRLDNPTRAMWAVQISEAHHAVVTREAEARDTTRKGLVESLIEQRFGLG